MILNLEIDELVGAAVGRIARVQMDDRRAGLGGADRGFGDLSGSHRQMRRHRWRGSSR